MTHWEMVRAHYPLRVAEVEELERELAMVSVFVLFAVWLRGLPVVADSRVTLA